jgi:DNA-binding PadR family transcriptional regulator
MHSLARLNIFHANANHVCYNGGVKGDKIGEFEELLLLAVLASVETPCVVPIQQYLERATARGVSLGAVYAGLDRLEHKGLVTSSFTDATPVPGGKRKRVFQATRQGLRTVQTIRTVRDAMWKAIEERR